MGEVRSTSGPSAAPELADRLAGRREAILERWYASHFDAQRIRRWEIEGADALERERAIRCFLEPLLGLLIEHLRSGDPAFLDLYLDERLRYAPHRAEPEVRAEFFRELLAQDESALEGEGELDAELRDRVRALHAPLLAPPGPGAMRVLAVGDCLMNDIRVFLPGRCRAAGFDVDLRCAYFSAVVGRDLHVEETVRAAEEMRADIVAMSFLTYEGLPLYPLLLREGESLSGAERSQRIDGLVGVLRRFLEALRERTDATVLLHDASGLPLDGLRRRLPFLPVLSRGRRRLLEELNARLTELASHVPNTLLLPEAELASARGLRACAREVAPRRIASRAFFHTAWFGAWLADAYRERIDAYRRLHRAKVLAVDFDNTLWEGVMADGEVRHDRAAQRLLRKLKDAGILLVAVSKNDEKNVRWDELELAPDDFVLRKIGWDLKVRSIQQAASELDLGLDSFVLLDDSPEERALVEGEIPQVRTLDSRDPQTWRALEWMLAFPNTRDTEEARSRTELYREQARRREALSGELDYAAMMGRLELRARIGPALGSDLERVGELVQRTNQFNTTTIRYGASELEGLLDSAKHALYVAELSDRYGSFGLVAVVVVERLVEEARIEAFVMSCRAMGFGLEGAVLARVIEAEGVERFVGRYVPSERNGPCEPLFREAGFQSQGEGTWVLEPEDPRPEVPSWLAVEDR